MTVLLVALMSISAATLRSHTLRRQNRERTLVVNSIKMWAERIHSYSYTDAYTQPGLSWSEAMLAAYGAGGTVGNTFNVLGLNPVPGQANMGTITLITDETQTDAALNIEAGMPRDLNGDQDAVDADVSADARMIPVLLTINWRGINRDSTESHVFYVMGF